MATQTKTKLPLHVKGDWVLKVIGKVVGAPWSLNTFAYADNLSSFSFPEDKNRKKMPFDPSLPASRENRWHISFENMRTNMRAEITAPGMSVGVIFFRDGTGQEHEWSWHPECVEEDGKLLTSGSHALGISVARRLVRFFGGQVCYADKNERVDYEVLNEAARFPRKTPDQTGDDRWDQFQNALLAESLLTSQELQEAVSKSDNPQVDYRALMDFLDARNLESKMDHNLPENQSTPSRSRSIMRL